MLGSWQRLIASWGALGAENSRLHWFRFWFYLCISIEALWHLRPGMMVILRALSFIPVGHVYMPLLSKYISYIIFGRFLSALLMCLGVFSNLNKFLVLIFTLCEYNQLIFEYNNHYTLEVLICFFALFVTWPKYDYKYSLSFFRAQKSKNLISRNIIFWFLMKALLVIVYFHTALIKIPMYFRFRLGLQLYGLFADASLFILVMIHGHSSLFRRILIVAALIFHFGTLIRFRSQIGLFPFIMFAIILNLFIEENDRAWFKSKLNRLKLKQSQ